MQFQINKHFVAIVKYNSGNFMKTYMITGKCKTKGHINLDTDDIEKLANNIEPGVVIHVYSLSLRRRRSEEQGFKDSLSS